MDGQRFDQIAMTLGAGAGRRQVLRGLLGTATLGGLLARLGAEEAAATHHFCEHVGERCASPDDCCSGICRRKKGTRRKTCRAHDVGTCTVQQDFCQPDRDDPSALCGKDENCLCFRTTGGARFCGQPLATCNPPFCRRDPDCGEGEACVPSLGDCAGSIGCGPDRDQPFCVKACET